MNRLTFYCIIAVAVVWGCNTRSDEDPSSAAPEATADITATVPASDEASQSPFDQGGIWGQYLASYYETHAKSDLDSAVATFDRFEAKLMIPDPYLSMGVACEILELKQLAHDYYTEGKAVAAKLLSDPNIEGRPIFQLYKYYFELLLNEKVDLKKVTALEKEVGDAGGWVIPLTIPDGHSRKELLDAFAL